MSQTTITLAFEQWKAQQGTTGEPVLLDEFVFANVPGLDPDQPVDRNETLPPAEQIVHRQAVSRKGVVNDNAVVHSVVLGADVGDFSFNWIGLINKASGTLAMIVHAPLQQKLKTAEGQQGNVLTRSFLMEYNGAQAETGINTPAETWQIDFTARMAGMDERQRLENIDIFGAAAFFGDGYLVGKSGNQFYVTKGTGYVAGLRTTLAENLNITVTTRPVKVWLDVCWTGTLTSVWGVQSRITVADNLADYVQNGVQHYVFAVAGIDENGNITDLRPKGTLNEQQASDALRKHAQSRNHPDATTREKGFVQLSSDTSSESESLAATPKAVKAAMDNANGRVPSDRKVNGHPLSGDITLWASDVKAISADAIGQITDNGTMASANTPGWWRVAVSNSDTVADFPTYPDGSKLYSYGYMFVEKIGEVWFQHYYAHMGANAKRQDWGTVPNTSRPWVIDYNTANKPSAGDVGALPITGGRINGSLGIGTDNALGGNSIVFGDNDTGFKWHSDGVLGIYANNAQVGYIDNSGLHMLADIRATGVVRAGNGKTLTLSSGNNSALNAGFSLWGGGERPTVIELSDDQGWHLY
ncbi:phage tail protein, partial [Salmonella enterica]|nr:phage tail protein [Salmonella enterica]